MANNASGCFPSHNPDERRIESERRPAGRCMLSGFARMQIIGMDGNVLKESRRKKHWTQEQAALALDVTQAYLSMLEKGRRPLSERFVSKASQSPQFPPYGPAAAIGTGSDAGVFPDA